MANLTDADGYVVNATSDTAGTVTQQVEGGSQNTTTLRGLRVGTTYVISVRAYQDILGPVSTISEQTFSSGILLLFIVTCVGGSKTPPVP